MLYTGERIGLNISIPSYFIKHKLYIQVDQLPKARECVQQLRYVMTSSCQRPPVNDVMKLVKQCMASGHTIRAMCLLVCVSKLHNMDSKPDHAVVAIRNCSSMIDDVIRVKTKGKSESNDRIIEFGLYLMDGIIKDLRGVENATPGIKADMEARCLCDIGLSSRASKKIDKAIDSFKLGIRSMKKQFGLNAFKFQIYGHLCNNLAIIYRLREQYGKALKHYNLCLKAYNDAIDWESAFLKNKRVQSTNVNVALLKKKSGENN